jgi:type I restriction enzyme S subunit
MSEWSYRTLDQMGIVSRGKSKHRPRNDVRLFGGKYPFIQTGDIGAAGLYVTEYSQTYNEEGLAQSKCLSLYNVDSL